MNLKEQCSLFFRVWKVFLKRLGNSLDGSAPRPRRKIFVIGMNKTGTTSIKKALEDLGFLVGDQLTAELLLDEVICGDYSGLIRYCKRAEAFQDIPFSCPKVYQRLDREFPKSKFILSVRDSPEQWYQSLLSFHSKVFGAHGRLPTSTDLQLSDKVSPGWAYRCLSFIFPGMPLYDKKGYLEVYADHLDQVVAYFKNRPNDLLVLNLSEPDAYYQLCSFLNCRPIYKVFPWENKTADL